MNQRYPISFSKKNEYETSDFRFIDVRIKKVKVPSSAGNKSKEIVTSDCYFFIHLRLK